MKNELYKQEHLGQNEWFIKRKNGEVWRITDFGYGGIKNDLMIVFYLKDKQTTGNENITEDYNLYFPTAEQAKEALKGYSYKMLMEVDIMEININDIKCGNRGRQVYFVPKIKVKTKVIECENCGNGFSPKNLTTKGICKDCLSE